MQKTGLESKNIHFRLISGPHDICVKLIVKTVFKHWQIKMCRPIDQTYRFLFFSPSPAPRCLCKLPISCKVRENSVKCDCGFLVQRNKEKTKTQKKKRPAPSRIGDACAPRRDAPRRGDVSAATPCSANVSPVQLNARLMPLPTRDSLQ